MNLQSNGYPETKLKLAHLIPLLYTVCSEGMLVSNRSGEILMCNPACSRMFGYEKDELHGQQIEVLVPVEVVSRHKKIRENFGTGHGSRPMGLGIDLRGRKKDGSTFPVEISLNHIHTEDGEIIVALIVDISIRKKTEKALIQHENLLNAIIESAVDGIITISEKGVIESANPAAEKLFGYGRGELIGQKVNILMPEQHQIQHDQYIANYLQTGERKIMGIGREVSGIKKDGSEFPFYLSVSEVDHGDKKIFSGIIHDLTDQKNAEKELKEYSEKLEQRVEARTEALEHAIGNLENEIKERKLAEAALLEHQQKIQMALEKERELNELKSRFVSMASHEFRTPLATILSSISLVNRYDLPEHKAKRDKHIERIRSNVKLLTNILNDFLSLSKLEEGIVNFEPELTDIEEFIHEFIEEISEQKKEGQKIIYTNESPENQAEIDPHLMKNVLFNLLSNAIKYSPENSNIEIITRINDQEMILSVSDQGMGIPEADQVYLFERFFRAKNATNIQGTGLGLSIVKRYIDLMNGDISFSSTDGEGTTFTIQIPIRIAQNEKNTID